MVIYDRSGEFVKSYYDPSIDKILNPLDARCAAWDLWKECLTQPDFDNTANTLIPMGTKEDPFWQGSGRTIFAEAAYLMRNDPNRSYSKLVDTLLSIKIEKLRTFLRNSPAARSVTGLPYLNGKPRCRRVCCVNHNGSGKRSGRLPGKICCRNDFSRWNGIWFVTCRKRKPWAETDTGRQTLMTTDNTNTRNDSLAARTDTWLQSLLVWSPGQRDIIKTVALVLMVLDHINLIFQLKQEWMFLAGRGAFPLFALVWGLNLSRHAHIRQVAINRLWGWGIIAQFAYYLAGFPWYEGNILFAFAVAAQVLTWCETRSGWRTAAAILLMALWGPLSGTSYGIAGLLMLAVSHRLYRAEDRTERLALVACLLAVIPALNLATSDAAAVAGLVMTVLTVGLVSCAGKSLPRFWPGDFFPTFYACHLAVLGVLAL